MVFATLSENKVFLFLIGDTNKKLISCFNAVDWERFQKNRRIGCICMQVAKRGNYLFDRNRNIKRSVYCQYG